MLWIIDPDVFEASLTNELCSNALERIKTKIRSNSFATDKKDEQTIWSEYVKIYSKYKNSHEEHPAVQILGQIINMPASYHLVSSARKPYNKIIGQFNCNAPVEPDLLALAANCAVNSPTLLLCGEPVKIRERELHKPEVCRKIRNTYWSWLDVDYASNKNAGTKRVLPEMANELSNPFELSVALFLNEIEENINYHLPPPEDKYGGQIDLWGLGKSVEGKIITIVGECKLRNAGNENKDISLGEVEQVVERAETVKERYKELRRDNFEVRIYIVSNANSMTPAAIEKAKTVTKSGFQIKHWKADLEDGWNRSGSLRVIDVSLIDDFQVD